MTRQLLSTTAAMLLLSTGCSLSTTPVAPSDTSSIVCIQPTASDIHWDTSPDALIIRYWEAVRYCCYDRENVIPPLQIWGDGRIIWLNGGSVTHQRQMMTGYLTQAQMRELLQRIVNAGFFEWEEEYRLGAAPPIFDILVVNLASHSDQPKLVAVDGGGRCSRPGGFGGLKEFLFAVPAAATNVESYVPDRAYLETSAMPPEWSCSHQWPDTSYDLSQATSGMYIEGEALAATWEAVNEYPCGDVCMQSDEGVYDVRLIVPGVSLYSEQLHPAFRVGGPVCR